MYQRQQKFIYPRGGRFNENDFFEASDWLQAYNRQKIFNF